MGKTVCPHCGAKRVPDASKCWLCLQPIADSSMRSVDSQGVIVAELVATSDNPYSPPVTAVDEASREGWAGSARLGIVIAAVVIVFGGVAVAAPGIGIPLAILVTPAAIRTAVRLDHRRDAGEASGPGTAAITFLASLAAVVTAAVAACVAFFVTCVVTCFGASALDQSIWRGGSGGSGIVMMGLCAAAGIAAAVLVIRAFWKKR